ncbi:MAG: TIGR03621 family F420-dependent LLM class oxidoreductase [Actinomycetota bacterium]
MSPLPPRPFRFGVQLTGPPAGSSWSEQARRLEDLGYAVATMPDHFTDQYAPMPALQAVLDATTTLRAGALVFDNDYKHPAVLAKELATMDVISGGRVEIGLGAGWMVADYEQTGMPYDRAGVRIDRMVEGLAVLRGAMSPGPFSFAGEHYTISDYDGTPKPVQSLPPVLIGGGGRRVLSIAAQEADIVGINASLHAGRIGPDVIKTMTADAVAEKVAIVADAGAHRLDDIELNIRTFFVRVTDDRAGAIETMSPTIGVHVSTLEDSPFALIGSTEQLIEQLLARREKYGFSYVIIGPEVIDAFAPVVAALAGT